MRNFVEKERETREKKKNATRLSFFFFSALAFHHFFPGACLTRIVLKLNGSFLFE